MSRTLLLVLLALLPSVAPAGGTTSLYERNLAVLRETLPHDALVEVRIYDGDGERAEVWSAEQYATFRARFAASMGRDYAAAADGVPSGLGHAQELLDMFMDLWGTTRVNVVTPRACNPTFFTLQSKWWFYPGPCFVGEHDNACFDNICSFSYYWTITQGGATHGDAWFAGFGTLILFPAPHGAIIEMEGTQWREQV